MISNIIQNMNCNESIIDMKRIETPEILPLPKEKVSLSMFREVKENQEVEVKITRPVINEGGETEYEIIKSITLKLEPTVEILGDEFYFSIDSEGCYIHHPYWSLIGEGNDFREAKEDLLSTIRHIKENFLKSRIEQLDARAVQFREYLLSLPI
jgi:hypothetical protein